MGGFKKLLHTFKNNEMSLCFIIKAFQRCMTTVVMYGAETLNSCQEKSTKFDSSLVYNEKIHTWHYLCKMQIQIMSYDKE